MTWSTPQADASARGWAHVPRHLWRPPLLILALVHGPHSALDVLHAHKALVQAEVVPHGILGVWGQGECSEPPAPLRQAHMAKSPSHRVPPPLAKGQAGCPREESQPGAKAGLSPALDPGTARVFTAHNLFYDLLPSPCHVLENAVYQLNAV